MAGPTDSFDLGALGLSSGEARRLDLLVRVDPVSLGGEEYSADPAVLPLALDVVRTGSGYSVRIRFEARLGGPCMRCLEAAGTDFRIDVREIHQAHARDPELASPYVDGSELDVRGWTRDALLLALPDQIVCRDDCPGLCGMCGENLGEAPGHAHERSPDPRWAKLSELGLD